MLIHIENLLNPDELNALRTLVLNADWADGRSTAGQQSAQVKNNRQLAETTPELPAARRIVMKALARHPVFFSAALPHDILPPLFNRYGIGEYFGPHIDNAVRLVPDGSRQLRTDLSATLFINAPEDYDGGELVIEDHYGKHAVKLAAGDMILYPGSSLHHVSPVTRGERVASFFWIQSMIRDAAQRNILFNMDTAIATLRKSIKADDQHSDHPALVQLTGCYHNLLRQWTEL